MRRSGKNGERAEQIRGSKKKPAKVEPLRPQAEHTRKFPNDLAKFPEENPYPVLRIHRGGTVLYANKAGELILKAKNSGVSLPAPPEWCRLVNDVLVSGQVVEDGMEYEGRIYGFKVVPIVSNNYVNFYGADITDHKHTEEALRESEDKFKTLADESFDSIVIHDGGRIVEVNKTFGEKWGYKPEETVGLKVDKLIDLESLEMVKEKIRCGYDKPYEAVAVSRNGERFTIEIVGKPLTYKGGTVRIATARDITDRKRAEQALREEEMRFRSLFDQAADAIVVIDARTGEMAEFNDKAHQMLGYSRAEYAKLKLSDIEAIESKEEVAAHIDKIVRQGSDIFEAKQRKKDGTLRDILVSSKLITVAGKPYLQAIWRDITEIKKADAKLREYQKQLKQLASQLALTEERQRRRIAGELHDQLCQSLALAKIRLDAIRSSGKSKPAEEELMQVSDAMQRLIDQTRLLVFDLSSPILYELGFEAAVAEWLNEQVHDKGGIETEFQDDHLPKPLDDDVRMLLFRNVRELLINVIKHSHASKVKVCIRRVDDSIEITVKDNGIGFNPAEAKTMAAKTAKFGLFSIRESVEQLGGRFEIESKPDAGCKATIAVPLKGHTHKREE